MNKLDAQIVDTSQMTGDEISRRNRAGILSHYGWCLGCCDTWDWKRPHYIGRTMFPYCEECHQSLTIEQKKVLVTLLVNSWARYFKPREDDLEKGAWAIIEDGE